MQQKKAANPLRVRSPSMINESHRVCFLRLPFFILSVYHTKLKAYTSYQMQQKTILFSLVQVLIKAR